ncbi:MAG: Rrf2 family transcriptional regulator [Candidatus Kapabacteria bacterium]|jgi:Rrf2 family protein|nr:Rrf2 family transcriptional regulator [Candidatus Kapabacteria bacterium]
MIRLSKKVEYGLLALQFIANRPDEKYSSKEIADFYGISFELLSKVLQQLQKLKYITSVKGVHGGYILTKDASDISVGDVIRDLSSEKKSLVECTDVHKNHDCYAFEKCTLKTPLQIIQNKINEAFNLFTIRDLVLADTSEDKQVFISADLVTIL